MAYVVIVQNILLTFQFIETYIVSNIRHRYPLGGLCGNFTKYTFISISMLGYLPGRGIRRPGLL